jgi:hypothetical protein
LLSSKNRRYGSPTIQCRIRNITALSVTITSVVAASACSSPPQVVINGTSTTPSPPTSPPVVATTAPSIPQITFKQPDPKVPISPGDDVMLSGTISGLNGRELWVISRTDSADQLYSIITPSPVTKSDGSWTETDETATDNSDRGHHILFIGVAANQKCADSLNSVKADSDGVRSFQALSGDCQAIDPPLVVSVRK